MVAREGIELIAAQSFRSKKLRSIQGLVKQEAASILRRLEKLTTALAECDKDFFDLPSRPLIIRTQICFAIEEWRRRHGGDLRVWLDAWAEFEALASISGYAWENPADPFPEFENSNATFVACGIGHPLIPSAGCVRNNISLINESRFYVVSGSNMSGKSTLMRSVGLNAVLAKAGAPVRAYSLRLSNLAVFASLSVVDTILEGKSRFFAEVERVRQTLESARLTPVLFLIDEILSGTNSQDRRIASEAIVRALIALGAIGVLSTHDLALTEIAELSGLQGSNVHMGSRSGENVMDFDYLLKPGATTETNALAIAAMMGVPL
jgi:DNA mismatch repair ATPase MutS